MGGRKGHSNKRARPEDDNSTPATESATTLSTATPKLKGPERKKQKRDEYKASLDDAGVELPKKKYYRQRAHANPFSDHALS